MQTSYQHPWYLALNEQDSTTTSELKLKQKQRLEELGPTFIKYKDPSELIWAAGLFEGEGWLTYTQKTDRWQLAVEMADLDVVERFNALWKLNWFERAPKQDHHKITYRAYTGARDKIFEVISDLYPDLGNRRQEKADEFLAWYQDKVIAE